MFPSSDSISQNSLWKEQVADRKHLSEINTKHWLENNLFTPVWWLMLIMFIMSWYIWWKLVYKNRLHEIIIYGLMVIIGATILDIFGTEFVLWGYPNMLIPTAPPLFFVDICILPIIYMLVYQYFTRWKSFLTAMIITAAIISFIGEPIAVWLEIYELNNWNHLYSFPIYIILAIIFKWICSKIIKYKRKSSV
jgi:hypothetical protein